MAHGDAVVVTQLGGQKQMVSEATLVFPELDADVQKLMSDISLHTYSLI